MIGGNWFYRPLIPPWFFYSLDGIGKEIACLTHTYCKKKLIISLLAQLVRASC